MTEEERREYNRKYKREWMRRKRAANPELAREMYRRYANYERTIARHREWAKANPFENSCCCRAVNANRDYPGHLTAIDIRTVLQRQTFCYWCGKELPLLERTVEHLKPVNDLQWLTVACLSCNSKRHHRNWQPIEWKNNGTIA